MEKSIIIIGAGLAGLSAGCYGRMNGYRTSLFEMSDTAGGVCTAWKRKGYTIDGAMNWLLGTKPGTNNYKIWEELGATRDWKIFDHERYLIDEGSGGKPFSIYCDADRFEQYLLDMSPEDKDAIIEFTSAIRQISGCDFPVDKPEELYDEKDYRNMEKFMPVLQIIQKWSLISPDEFAGLFKNPMIQKLPYYFGHVVWMLRILAWQHGKTAGYQIGGSLELIKSIEKRYRELGGEIHFKSKVVKIIVENEKAVGIKLDDGSEYRADYVVSAADGRSTIFDMLDGKYVDDMIGDMYKNPKLYKPLIYIGLGVNRSFNDMPTSLGGITWQLDKPIDVSGNIYTYICSRIFNFDPAMSPDGKEVILVHFQTEYSYWKELKAEPDRYRAEKEKIAGEVINRLNERFPGISGQVEVCDVATPVTWERYTGNWQGSYEGWTFDLEYKRINKTLPGLDNFYMAGQWVNPGGGMPAAVVSGNHTIQFICNKDKKEFVTTSK